MSPRGLIVTPVITQKLWVLMIGVNHYEDSSLPDLAYSTPDCQLLEEVLTSLSIPFAERQLFVHHCLTPQLPTLAAVRQSLDTILRNATKYDTVLFYFSGHGLLTGTSCQPVLCLRDTNSENLSGTGLLLQEVLQKMHSCWAQQQLLWLDACHSGGLSRKGQDTLPNPMAQLVEVLGQQDTHCQGFYALLSCEQDERSWEIPALRHGLFTHFLVRGLQGEAADERGRIEMDRLYKYVYRKTRSYLDNLNHQIRLENQGMRQRGAGMLCPEYPLQHPKRIIEGGGEIILGFARQDQSEANWQRQALVVEGLGVSEASLGISKTLAEAGAFMLHYWSQIGQTRSSVYEAIEQCLSITQPSLRQATILLYLRGHITQTAAGDSYLVVGEEKLSLEWLQHTLQQAQSQYLLILDCPGAVRLDRWFEALQLGSEVGQCLLAAAAPSSDPEQFAQALLETLQEVDPGTDLSVASWINRLQEVLGELDLPLHCWLSATRGVIDILPGQRPGIFRDLGVCPYRGLQALTIHDAPYFYGREPLIQEVLQQLRTQPFLAVVGSSGSGKSSLVQAGVMAQIRQGRQIVGSNQWRVLLIRPSTQPLLALAQGLDLQSCALENVEAFVRYLRERPEPMVVLVVDQFEELFTLSGSAERQQFLELILGALTQAADRFRVLVTLRADFIGAALAMSGLAPLVKRAMVLVPAVLTREDYHQVILAPAEKVGLRVEPELVEVLLQDVTADTAGDLALLAFVLEQLWECREDGILTLRCYQEEIGGLKGALERKAKKFYTSLDSESQQCARWLLLSLVHLGEGVADTRRRIYRSALRVKRYPPSLVDRLLERFKEERLLVLGTQIDELAGQKPTTQESTVEIAHEILIREWSTLRGWIEENRAQLRLQRQLELAQKEGFPLQGVLLAQAEDLYRQNKDELPETLQKFIEAGLTEREGELQAQKRRLRQTKIAAGVMGVLAILALGALATVYYQSQKSNEEQINALLTSAKLQYLSHQEIEALSTSLLAQNLVQKTWTSSPLLRQSVQQTLQQMVQTIHEHNRLEGHTDTVKSVAFSPDGMMLATGSWDSTIRLWRKDGTLKPVPVVMRHKQAINQVRFSPDGQWLVSSSDDGTVRRWTRDGRLIYTLNIGAGRVGGLAVSPDGKILASVSADGYLRLWESKTGKSRGKVLAHQKSAEAVVISAVGIITGGSDGVVRLWNNKAHFQKILLTNAGFITDIAVSPDKKWLAVAGQGAIYLKSLEQEKTRIIGWPNNKIVSGVAFNPDGLTLAASSTDGVRLWTLEGVLQSEFLGHSREVTDVAYSPDGLTLATSSHDRTTRLWDLAASVIIQRPAHPNHVISIAFTPDGKRVVTGGLASPFYLWTSKGQFMGSGAAPDYAVAIPPDGKLLVTGGNYPGLNFWSPTGKHYQQVGDQPGPVDRIAFSSDSNLIVVATPTKGFWLRNRSSRKLLGHGKNLGDVAIFSPDHKFIVTGETDGTIRYWDIAHLDRVPPPLKRGHTNTIKDLTFSPDGTLLASASLDTAVKLWDRQGNLLRTLPGHTDGVDSVSFSSDSQLLASGSQDGIIRLWNRKGDLVNILYGHRQGIRVVRFQPQGNMLISGDRSGTIFFWNNLQPSTTQLVTQGCSWLEDYVRNHQQLNALCH